MFFVFSRLVSKFVFYIKIYLHLQTFLILLSWKILGGINLKKIRKKRFQYLVIYFIIYSFIGWTMETTYAFYVHGHFVNRGFLFGPICPLYGFGAIILIIFFKKYKNHSIKLFLTAGFVFSVFEYITGYVLEALFKLKWWDYTSDFINLNGRVSILYSFIWGIVAILFLNHIHPFMKKKAKQIFQKIPSMYKTILVYLLIIILISDTILSSLHVLEFI